MSSLLVVTGPPGAGKSTVAARLASQLARSVLVLGDDFFGFLAAGAVEPWRPESHLQNTVVTEAAAAATGRFACEYDTVYDGILGPWFLPTFGAGTGLVELDYVVLLPDVETCVRRVHERTNHGFSNETATRKMHAEFSAATIAAQHVLTGGAVSVGSPAETAAAVSTARAAGALRLVVDRP